MAQDDSSGFGYPCFRHGFTSVRELIQSERPDMTGLVPHKEILFTDLEQKGISFYATHDGSPAHHSFRAGHPPKVEPLTEEDRREKERIHRDWNRLRKDYSGSVDWADTWLKLLENIHRHYGSIEVFLRATKIKRSTFYRERKRVLAILLKLYVEMLKRRGGLR